MSPRTIPTAVLILSCLILTSGCHRNRTKTSAQPLMPSTIPAPSSPAPPTDSVAPEPDEVEGDPMSGELGDLNESLRHQGLLGDVYFDFDRAELTAEARDRLAKDARFLQEHPEISVILEGHCDERGTSEYNLALGDRRAQSTLSYLVSLGVPQSRLRTISYGEERSVCTELEESCWWRNRRAHPLATRGNDH